MKCEVRNAKCEMERTKYEVRSAKYEIKTGKTQSLLRTSHTALLTTILIAFLLSLNFTGCLFTRPYTPSARLIPANQLSYSFGGGSISYTERVMTQDNYSYPSYTYTAEDIRPTAVYADLGARVRIPGSDFELGVNWATLAYLSFDLKYAFTKPGQDAPLIALDTALYIGANQNLSAGFSAGPVINFPLIKESNFDFVTAVYYHYFDYKNFANHPTTKPGDNVYGGGTYSIAPSKSSFYLYAGFEFALSDGTVVAPGAGYTYFMASPFQPGILTIGVTCKYGAAQSKAKTGTAENYRAYPEIGVYTYINAAKEMIEQGNILKASGILARGLLYSPGDYDLSLMQGFCMAKLGKMRLAYKYYTDALALDLENPDLQETVKNIRNELKGR
jgi:hypothetical protein